VEGSTGLTSSRSIGSRLKHHLFLPTKLGLGKLNTMAEHGHGLAWRQAGFTVV